MPPMLARFTLTQIAYAAVVALLLGAFMVQTFRIEGLRVWPINIRGYKDDSAELDRLKREGKQKQIEVREVIKEGKTRIVTVEKQAEQVEQAPLEGECRTPKAVLEADV